ncbi:FAD-dependent monooxygenase [Curvibacter sp. APW13]|uniref:NAD(P)/FAD-dependent oxidoreductase n=1 Tax=Curvibacter sp. APW13 TaxID=3077236 RepID=UPI0028DF871E|nr:FAD-dependent monooxygenase [Curvibacter sp. APW13]MDT8992625.1 FAD-dependent monooxygenase [Curvibacter sp. APW13]
MERHFDSIIVGAGPAGSTAAILLAHAGWRVALMEKHLFPRRKVCGECIAASNLPLLDTLGIGAAFDALAGPELRQVALMHGTCSVEAKLPGLDGSHLRFGRALGRGTLDTLLLEQARKSGVQVLQPWTLQGIEGQPGQWRVQCKDLQNQVATTLSAPIAIDAHGSWERFPFERSQQPLRASDLLAFKANFVGALLPRGLLPVLSFEGGYGGMVMADRETLTLACCIRRDRLAALRRKYPGMAAGGVVELMLRQSCSGVDAALIHASRAGAWLAAGPLRTGIRIRSDDAVFRIGNAAAESHPIIGEGMSMAFQSAWLLCTHLIGTDTLQRLPNREWQRAVGKSYAQDWNLEFMQRMHLASVFAHVAMRPAAFSLLMRLAGAWPRLLPLGATLGGKTRFITTTRRTA